MAAVATKTERPPGGQQGSEHKPYVPDSARMPEFTWGAVVVGSLLGIVFGASSLYLTLKVGLTVSASIPVAVLAITLSRVASRLLGIRRTTILENNIVQTAGSSGESIAFGIGVTMPALMILGDEMDVGRAMVVAVLGGLLGILMMIPLRRAFIVKQHDTLKYPEGTACADVLIVGEQGGASAKTVFVGFGLAFVYQILMQGMKFWKEVPEYIIKKYKGAVAGIEVNPALLGVGYIIGTRISCIMLAGGLLTYFVIMPAIHLFGDDMQTPVYPATIPIHEMGARELRENFTLYIGAGAVTAGGIISLFQSLPLIVRSLASGLRDMSASRRGGGGATIRRTDRDMPMWLVGIGSLVLVGAIWSTKYLHESMRWIPDLKLNWVGALMVVVFGFLFVTVSSRLTGEIGSSSNPISGMTVATLLLTCLIFLAMKMTTHDDRIAALSVAAVVCVAASNGGTTSQDLKTGYLVGATPRLQQWAIVAGTMSSALVIGVILIVLNNASTVYSTRNLPMPAQAINVSQLTDVERAPNDETAYHVWRPVEGNPERVPPGKYLVDDSGRIRYLVDPGINGRLAQRDDGGDVQKYDAPKAKLMALITDGILNQKLPWALVLLGVFISIVLELSGVPSLPFAVGVYLPISTSTPIFAGGLIRYLADRFAKNAGEGRRSEAESEMSPGVLLSTGYIAGGSIGGVLIAFLSFGDTIPNWLGQWQYRQVAVGEGPSFQTQLDQVAARELGVELPTAANAPEDKLRLKAIRDLDDEIVNLNKDHLARIAPVPAGIVLKLPSNKSYRVPTNETLGAVSKELYKTEDKAQQLLELNENVIPVPARLPADTLLKLPQHTWPSLAAFGALAALLLFVGLGWLFAGGPPPRAPKPAAAPSAAQDGGGQVRRPPPDRK
jgi:putative OPT family oligopeptide transporter